MKKSHLPMIGAAVGTAAWLLWGNRAIETTHYTVSSSHLPTAFDGFRIALITDLHNTLFGPHHEKLLTKLRDAKPQMIAIAGDMLDARRTDIDCALEFAAEAVKIAPCYYVMGNHEARIRSYPAFEYKLRRLGVQVLRSEAITLSQDGSTITLIGMDDPAATAGFNDTLCQLCSGTEDYTILLSHRPERFEVYQAAMVDLALCGHSHGGQVRIPYIGGVIAPHQGFFPKYDCGVFRNGSTTMILSRGLGNSLCPLRVNDRPELPIIELRRKLPQST